GAVTQLDHIAQLVQDVVEDIHGLVGEVVETRELGLQALQALQLLFFAHACEGFFQYTQAAQYQGLDGVAYMQVEFIAGGAGLDPQGDIGLQQVLHRAAVEGFLYAVDIDGAAEFIEVAIEQATNQAVRIGRSQNRFNGRFIQPQPEQASSPTKFRRLVADIGGVPGFGMLFLRHELRVPLGSPA